MTPTTSPDTHLPSQQLHAFIDGELSSSDTQAVQQHLESCHSCGLRVISAMQLKASTARAAQRFTASPETLARLTAYLHTQSTEQKQPTPIRPRTFRMLPVWSAIAAMIVLTASFVLWNQNHQTNTLTAELLDQHLATLSSGAAPQVISTDRHTVKPWFQGRLPFSFNLPEPGALPPDTTLQGADLVYLKNRPAALLLFTIHKHQVSVFLTQKSELFTLNPKTTHSGFNMHSATTPELNLTAVSDVNPAELDALVASLVKVQ